MADSLWADSKGRDLSGKAESASSVASGITMLVILFVAYVLPDAIGWLKPDVGLIWWERHRARVLLPFVVLYVLIGAYSRYREKSAELLRVSGSLCPVKSEEWDDMARRFRDLSGDCTASWARQPATRVIQWKVSVDETTKEELEWHRTRGNWRSGEEIQKGREERFCGEFALAGSMVVKMLHLVPRVTAPTTQPVDVWLETVMKRAGDRPEDQFVRGGIGSAIKQSIYVSEYLAGLCKTYEDDAKRLLEAAKGR